MFEMPLGRFITCDEKSGLYQWRPPIQWVWRPLALIVHYPAPLPLCPLMPCGQPSLGSLRVCSAHSLCCSDTNLCLGAPSYQQPRAKLRPIHSIRKGKTQFKDQWLKITLNIFQESKMITPQLKRTELWDRMPPTLGGCTVWWLKA